MHRSTTRPKVWLIVRGWAITRIMNRRGVGDYPAVNTTFFLVLNSSTTAAMHLPECFHLGFFLNKKYAAVLSVNTVYNNESTV